MDGVEAERVLCEQGSAVCLVVEPAAGLQQVYAHPAQDIVLQGRCARNWLNDSAIGGEAQIEDDVLDFLW